MGKVKSSKWTYTQDASNSIELTNGDITLSLCIEGEIKSSHLNKVRAICKKLNEKEVSNG